MATLALLFAMGGTAAAAVMITSNSQVAKNTISGHKPPSGAHPNIIGGSVNGADLSGDLKNNLTTHCPSGFSRAGDICFDAATSGGNYYAALSTCGSLGWRLPTATDVAAVYNHLGAPQKSEWTDGWYVSSSAAIQGTAIEEDSSRQIHLDHFDVGTVMPFRCVTTPQN